MISGERVTIPLVLSRGGEFSFSFPKNSFVGENGASFDGLASYSLHVVGEDSCFCSLQILVSLFW